jgi:hypothetical protein
MFNLLPPASSNAPLCIWNIRVTVLTYTVSVFQSEVIQIIMIPSSLLMTIDQTQPENVKYFNCLANLIINGAKVHVTLNAGFPWQKQHWTKFFFIHHQIRLNLRNELVKCYIWSIDLYGVETWTLWKVNQNYLKSFEVWRWGKMEKISWTDYVRNEILQRLKEGRNILHTIKRRQSM